MVADREIPAWQWTNTRPLESFTESTMKNSRNKTLDKQLNSVNQLYSY